MQQFFMIPQLRNIILNMPVLLGEVYFRTIARPLLLIRALRARTSSNKMLELLCVPAASSMIIYCTIFNLCSLIYSTVKDNTSPLQISAKPSKVSLSLDTVTTTMNSTRVQSIG